MTARAEVIKMRRREFIAGLFLAVTMRRAAAQHSDKLYRIAIVVPSAPVTRFRVHRGLKSDIEPSPKCAQ
jgi:hypothetical protein